MESGKKLIIWKLLSDNPNIASSRYRCLIPIFESEKKDSNFKHRVVLPSQQVNFALNPSALVFVKSFLAEDVIIAEQAHNLGVPVVMDLCDNIFFGDRQKLSQNIFNEMLKHVTLFTVPTVAMADNLRPYVGDKKILIIPDPMESYEHALFSVKTIESVKLGFRFQFLKFSKTALRIYWTILFFILPKERLSNFIKRVERGRGVGRYGKFIFFPIYIPRWAINAFRPLPNKLTGTFRFDLVVEQYRRWMFYKYRLGTYLSVDGYTTYRLLWFGNAGTAEVFGMTSLLDINSDLESLAQKVDFELLIVSNNYPMYWQLRKKLSPKIKTRYVEWSLLEMYKVLRTCDVTLIPNPKNSFTAGKSPNRALLSLSQGVPVVASATQSFEELKDFIKIENWETSITEYLMNPNIGKADVLRFKKVLENSDFNGKAIWSKWEAVLTSIT